MHTPGRWPNDHQREPQLSTTKKIPNKKKKSTKNEQKEEKNCAPMGENVIIGWSYIHYDRLPNVKWQFLPLVLHNGIAIFFGHTFYLSRWVFFFSSVVFGLPLISGNVTRLFYQSTAIIIWFKKKGKIRQRGFQQGLRLIFRSPASLHCAQLTSTPLNSTFPPQPNYAPSTKEEIKCKALHSNSHRHQTASPTTLVRTKNATVPQPDKGHHFPNNQNEIIRFTEMRHN